MFWEINRRDAETLSFFKTFVSKTKHSIQHLQINPKNSIKISASQRLGGENILNMFSLKQLNVEFFQNNAKWIRHAVVCYRFVELCFIIRRDF